MLLVFPQNEILFQLLFQKSTILIKSNLLREVYTQTCGKGYLSVSNELLVLISIKIKLSSESQRLR